MRSEAIFAKDGEGDVTNLRAAFAADDNRRKAGGGWLAQMAAGAEQSARQRQRKEPQYCGECFHG
jgi:hypothetical protein